MPDPSTPQPATPSAALDDAAEHVAAAATGSTPEPSADRLGWKLFVYTLATFALMMVILMPGIFSLAFKIQVIDPDNKEASLGLVASIGALFNIVALPLLGRWSDRSRGRWGRRRPFLIAGVVLVIVGFTTIAASLAVAGVVIGWSITQIGSAAISTAFAVIVVEHVPENRRGRFAALGGVATQFAGVVATLLGAALTFNMYALFLVPVAILIVAAVLYWVTIPDIVPSTRADAVGASAAEVLSSYFFNPRKDRDFAFVWIGKFFLQFGLAFFSTYQLYYLLDRLGLTPEEAGVRLALVGGIGILVTSLGAVASGLLSDRLRRRKPFIYLAAGLFALGLLGIAFAQDFFLYAAGGLLILGGAGIFGAVDVALASDVIPKKDAGRFMNIYGISASIPGALAPAIAPAILAVGGGANYTLLYVVAAVFAVIGGLAVIPIRSVR